MINKVFVYRYRFGVVKYFVQGKLVSDVTGEAIKDFGILVRCYSKRRAKKVFVCSESEAKLIKRCDKSLPPEYSPRLYEYVDYLIVTPVGRLPKGCYLYSDTAPSLALHRGGDSLTFAESQVGGEVVNDKTVHAGRLLQKDDGLIQYRDDLLLERDKELSTSLNVDSVTAYLEVLQHANEQARIEYEGKKLLGGE